MKLIAIFSIESLQTDTEKIFQELEIPVFSELDVRGFRLMGEDRYSNWFGSKALPTYSKLNFAFVDDQQANEILNRVKEINESSKAERVIHSFQLAVEKHV